MSEPEEIETGEGQPLSVRVEGKSLIVNGKYLEPSDGSELLQRALIEGIDEIKQGLEAFRSQMEKLHPGAKIALAPLAVMRLGNERARIFNDHGLELVEAHNQVLADVSLLNESIRPFWQAIEASGFNPEVRIYATSYTSLADINLYAKLPD